ncbi:polyvinyl alcohol dehydrogenase (cytochrome) [Humibacillus xanthopallidus]|uniref:Polyvinyl alcohol dehydrogenase (Cytochrome) n=1 Tax=Humibacillus xanthopallidus TaxID=412689 RepID=A0A543PM31_9MICO|nr:PQQ-binding-like beta-propeller repeat protein [Humibacillus xanthopallidus]TQN45124.1 polyvinyl alcohol dehydrogenase (cytochrome) [Humibacillus xanthopallidus]
MKSSRALLAAATAALLGMVIIAPSTAAVRADSWSSWGFDTSNSRYNPGSGLGVGNVGSLAVKWKTTTAGNVSATPAVEKGVVYVPDDAGFLYAIDAATGIVRWQTSIAGVTGIAGDYSRATPAIAGDILVLGDQAGKAFSPDGYLLGINKTTGALAWKTKVAGGYPILTQSATVVGGTAYVGVASYEEALVRFGYPLTFRGQMMAVEAATGLIKWVTYTVPAGYTGGSVWGSAPAVDLKRNSLYIATGNNYSIPDSATTCLSTAPDDAARAACIDAADMFDAIVSLDLSTGAVKWSMRALPSDAWNLACGIPFLPGFTEPTADCPNDPGPDFDFGQAPTLYKVKGTEYVGAGQKSGKYWAVNPDTGAVIWSTQAGTGGVGGGLQWGSAVDGSRVYTANANSEAKPWTLKDGSVTTAGGWSGLDAATGRIMWTTAASSGAGAPGPVTAVDGVVFGCSADADGHMYALKASSGAVLWDFTSGDTCYSGASVVGSTVYWGTGYAPFGPDPRPGGAVYAFSVNGK